jgi:hypothetical protein
MNLSNVSDAAIDCVDVVDVVVVDDDDGMPSEGRLGVRNGVAGIAGVAPLGVCHGESSVFDKRLGGIGEEPVVLTGVADDDRGVVHDARYCISISFMASRSHRRRASMYCSCKRIALRLGKKSRSMMCSTCAKYSSSSRIFWRRRVSLGGAVLVGVANTTALDEDDVVIAVDVDVGVDVGSVILSWSAVQYGCWSW